MLDAIVNLEPNWHPVFVHFVVGLLLTAAVALTVVALAPQTWQRRGSLQAAGDWMLTFGIAAALAAVAAGLQAYYTVAHDGPSHAAMTEHRNWALAATAVFLLVGLWRFLQRDRAPSALFVLVLIVAAGLLVSTGWHGGRLVFHHGLGVSSLPQAEGAGHDHDHGDGHDHGNAAAPKGDSGGAPEQGDGHDHDHGNAAPEEGAAPAAAAPDADLSRLDPAGVVDAFHGALKRKDEAAVRSLLMPDIFIYESGNAERSLTEYAGHHMPADMEFSASVERSVQARRVVEKGDTAFVLTEAISRGRFRGKDINVRTMETMVLTRTDPGWRIAHIHWSSAGIPEPSGDENHDHDDGHDHDH